MGEIERNWIRNLVTKDKKKYCKKQAEEEVIIIYTKPQLGFHHQVVQYSKALGPPSLSASVEQQGRRYQQRFDRIFQKGKNITRKRRKNKFENPKEENRNDCSESNPPLQDVNHV